jgi:hypothetical protein
MKYLPILLLITLFVFACKKETTSRQQTCWKGKYIGEGCWPVIQILDPVDESVHTAQFGVYDHTIGTGSLPDRFKDGNPFYFTISKVDSNKIYLTYCLPTKYFVVLNNLSDSACEFQHQ